MVEYLRAPSTKRGIMLIVRESSEYRLFIEGDQGPFCRDDETAHPMAVALQKYGATTAAVPSRHQPGEFYPRIWKGPESPTPEESGYRSEWISSVRASRNLSAKMRDVFRYIEPRSAHEAAYGHEIRELLILACTEVESAWKSALRANGVQPAGGTWSTRDYVKLLSPLRLDEWEVRLSTHPEYGPMRPFEGWEPLRPTQSLAWYDAYNAVKHDREGQLDRATFRAMVRAMSAVFVMTLAQFGKAHLEANDYFHPDEFSVTAEPSWPIDDLYIGLTYQRPDGSPLASAWMSKPYPF